MAQGQVALVRCSWTCALGVVSPSAQHLSQPTVGWDALVQGGREQSEEVKRTARSELLFWGQRGCGFELAGKLQTTTNTFLQLRLSLITSNYASCVERKAWRE